MVTSNKLPEKKIVKMADHDTSAVVPQRTLLGEVNEHITCPLCRGYYIDATTIVECLHSFCRSCIIKHLQVKSYCPVCEMMINSAKPNIKLDRALQDIVYKLVPGLFQREMERRQQFYASRPGPAASATPEQRGEDTERIIFSPEDVISFSLEFVDVTDCDSISSKSSDSNDNQLPSATTRRYLQCPAVVNISHLKKFLSMKFDIDSTQFAIDILYKRVSLPDCYTLMDIAYIYNWKRNEPMRFFYQIIDYMPIRNRLFEINKKGSTYQDVKPNSAITEDNNASSQTANNQDLPSDIAQATDSTIHGENSSKQTIDSVKKIDKSKQFKDNDINENSTQNKNSISVSKKNDDEVEKSQFLNSFELTAKNSSLPAKSSPVKNIVNDKVTPNFEIKDESSHKNDTLKRKNQIPPNTPEMKKLKIELEKTKISNYLSNTNTVVGPKSSSSDMVTDKKYEDINNTSKTSVDNISKSIPALSGKDLKQQHQACAPKVSESVGFKRSLSNTSSNTPIAKRKNLDSQLPTQISTMSSLPSTPSAPVRKTVSPLKLQLPKLDTSKSEDSKLNKKIPDLKPSIPGTHLATNKVLPVNKVRMDLLANNSDPTIDRSKILSQVKTSLSTPNAGQSSGDPLKSLFDSCKINIPSSLSITLTDQKLDPRSPNDTTNNDSKKVVNKNLTNASNVTSQKVPSPPVRNYIEILKLPDNETKKQTKSENNSDLKNSPPNKSDPTTGTSKPLNKTTEISAKGPIPNLKPISDTKLAKQSGSFSAPITFQQTFEQQLQSMQTDKKSKLPKNKAQVPKLVPASPKAISAANKLNNSNNKPNTSGIAPIDAKTGTALDLTTPHNMQNQLGHTKVFEAMQSIANLAKKQNIPTKGLPLNMSQNNIFSGATNRSLITGSSLRIPSTSNINQMKIDKANPSISQTTNTRPDMSNKSNHVKHMTNSSPTISSPSYQIPSQNSSSPAQPSPRSQTRSPSSSPKLVIAEDKQTTSSISEQNVNQSNQITSTQIPNNILKSESPKSSPGPSKPSLKPLTSTGKVTGIRQPIAPTAQTSSVNSPGDYITQPLMSAHHLNIALRHQMEMQNAWIKVQRQYDLFKNMSNIAHQSQNDFNKDKQ